MYEKIRKKEHLAMLEMLDTYCSRHREFTQREPSVIYLTPLQYQVYAEVAARTAEVAKIQILSGSFRGIPVRSTAGTSNDESTH